MAFNFKTEKKEKRNLARRAFTYYMPVIDDATEKMLGYLSDISPRGFRLDAKQPLPPNENFTLRFDLTDEVADKASMTVVARSRWCKLDDLDPFVYNVGFQLVSMNQDDLEIFKRILQKYGSG